MESSCCICGEDAGKDDILFSKLTEKGCLKINGINPAVNAKPGLKNHKKCRLDLLRPRGKSSDTKYEENASPVKWRSTQLFFSSSEHCLFCGQPAKYDGKKKGLDVMISVKTIAFQEAIGKLCEERNDHWARAVRR